LVPSGVVPHSSPSQIAALVGSPDVPVTCLELKPPQYPEAPEGWIQSEPWWVIHVEQPHHQVVRGAHGSCTAKHKLVFITDRTQRFVSAVGIGQKCKIRPYKFTKGR
jgi:hypothetical protein